MTSDILTFFHKFFVMSMLKNMNKFELNDAIPYEKKKMDINDMSPNSRRGYRRRAVIDA